MGTEAGDGSTGPCASAFDAGGRRAARDHIQLERVQYEIVKTVVIVVGRTGRRRLAGFDTVRTERPRVAASSVVDRLDLGHRSTCAGPRPQSQEPAACMRLTGRPRPIACLLQQPQRAVRVSCRRRRRRRRRRRAVYESLDDFTIPADGGFVVDRRAEWSNASA